AMGGRGVGLPHPAVPGRLQLSQRPCPGLVAGLSGAGRRSAAGPAFPGTALRRPGSGQPAARRRAARSRPERPDPCRGSVHDGGTGRDRQSGDPVPAGARTRRYRWGKRGSERPDHPAQRDARGPDRGGAGHALRTAQAVGGAVSGRVVVVGDLVTDVLAVLAGPPVPGTDTAARIRLAGGGQAGNTAAWLAHQQVPTTLVATVGDDAPGRARVAELTTAGVDCVVREIPGVPTGTLV